MLAGPGPVTVPESVVLSKRLPPWPTVKATGVEVLAKSGSVCDGGFAATFKGATNTRPEGENVGKAGSMVTL